jgi:hypothetical protein
MQKGSLLETVMGGTWSTDKGWGRDTTGPSKGEIVTHDGDSGEPGYIYLLEYHEPCSCGCNGNRSAYDKRCFREIQPPMQIDVECITGITQPHE